MSTWNGRIRLLVDNEIKHEGNLFGIRALEAGYCGGVTQPVDIPGIIHPSTTTIVSGTASLVEMANAETSIKSWITTSSSPAMVLPDNGDAMEDESPPTVDTAFLDMGPSGLWTTSPFPSGVKDIAERKNSKSVGSLQSIPLESAGRRQNSSRHRDGRVTASSTLMRSPFSLSSGSPTSETPVGTSSKRPNNQCVRFSLSRNQHTQNEATIGVRFPEPVVRLSRSDTGETSTKGPQHQEIGRAINKLDPANHMRYAVDTQQHRGTEEKSPYFLQNEDRSVESGQDTLRLIAQMPSLFLNTNSTPTSAIHGLSSSRSQPFLESTRTMSPTPSPISPCDYDFTRGKMPLKEEATNTLSIPAVRLSDLYDEYFQEEISTVITAHGAQHGKEASPQEQTAGQHASCGLDIEGEDFQKGEQMMYETKRLPSFVFPSQPERAHLV